jgi:hypothetical protein
VVNPAFPGRGSGRALLGKAVSIRSGVHGIYHVITKKGSKNILDTVSTFGNSGGNFF